LSISPGISVSFQSTLPVGGATFLQRLAVEWHDISIHAPRGGSDVTSLLQHLVDGVFQSTLPVGGATETVINRSLLRAISIHAPRGGSDWPTPWVCNVAFYISIHAPRGGSDNLTKVRRMDTQISIHAPRGGSDEQTAVNILARLQFQSTLPVGGATGQART